MRPIRILMAVSAAAVLAAACGGETTTGSGSSSSRATAAAPSPSAASGGGTADLSAAEILTKAQAALKAASSVHLKGGGTAEGQSFQLDMRYGSGGKAIGTVTANGQKVELRRSGQVVYVKADAAFWNSAGGAEAAKLLAGKYLKAPLTDSRVAGLASFTDKDSFTGEVLKPDGTVTKSGTKTIRGVPAVGLVTKGTSGSGTLYIAATGEALPLQVVPDTNTKDSGQLDFLDYGDTVDVPDPPAAQTIDVSKLGG